MSVLVHKQVEIPVGNLTLKGELVIPPGARAVVLFSHGSGSSRLSPRNQMVARYLQHKNMGTFLFDLLSIEEDAVYENRFDIPKLTRRLIAATEWLQELPAMKNLRMGYFGASTGAASALRAAAQLPQIAAVVSRGGRPDLAMDVLPFVKAPTLLIVGGLDSYVLELNREAYEQLGGIKKVEVVQGATHLFEEAGKMDAVCALAADWFEVFLVEGKEHVF